MSIDYGAWGPYNDSLAGPPSVAFVEHFTTLLHPGAAIFEVGIGSGRLALPLARAGFRVEGIDASEDMLNLLKANDPDGLVRGWQSDITEPQALKGYDAVLLAYNVLSMMPSRQAQVLCLTRASGLLTPGGVLIVENATPHSVFAQLNERNQSLGVQFRDGNVWLNLGRYFPEEERFLVRFLAFEDGSFVQRSGDLTLIHPETVRELVAAHGLSQVSLYSDWDGSAYRPGSQGFVATFRRT